jgi:arylsulfatase A-like enzyme
VIIFALLIVTVVAAVYFLYYSLDDGIPLPDPNVRYNLILIVSDAMRNDVLSCYGGEAQTPNLDWLAENGVLFENAYSTSPWTAPSAVSMFTGNYSSSYGHAPYAGSVQIYVPHIQLLLAEYLKETGYQAKMRIENIQASIHDNLQGFDNLIMTDPFKHPIGIQLRDSVCSITGGEIYNTKNYISSFAVLMYILGLSPEENFFIHHWIVDPHEPYRPVDKFKSRIQVKRKKLMKYPSFYTTGHSKKYEYNEEELKYIHSLYLAEVESVDERVGFVIELLKFKNLLDKTYIVFTSDHGEQFGQHGLHGHGGFGRGCHFYEGLVKVPLIYFGPNLPAGKRIIENISNIDLMPTLKDLLNVSYEADMQGESYKSWLYGKKIKARRVYFDDVRAHDQVDALLVEDYKLICLQGEKYQLFNISDDPEEEVDLASSHPKLVRKMVKMLGKIRKENEERKKINIAAIDDNMEERSEGEKRKIIQQLRALGYVK